MQLLKSILWLSFSDLSDFGISESYIKTALRRSRNGASSWSHIPDPADARRKLIDYDSIPATTIKKYEIPTKQTLLILLQKDSAEANEKALKRLQGEAARLEDFDYYTNAGIKRDRASGLAASAAWFRALNRVKGKTDVRAMELPGIETKTDLLEAVLEIVKTERPQGLHKVRSLQVFRRAYTRWNKADSEADKLNTLVHGHKRIRGISSGCQNARKMTESEEKVLLSKWLNTDTDVKLSPTQISAWYRNIAQADAELTDPETGEVYGDLTDLSMSTIKRLFARPEVKALGRYRHGSKYYKDAIRPYVFGKRPDYAFSFSSSDGFTMPFWLKLKSSNTWKRAVGYVIFDVHSTAIIGGAIGMSEDRNLMRAAFKDMIIRQGGLLPIDNQLDNFNKFYQDELEQIMGVRFCAPYNSQSKYAETNIKSLKLQVLSLYEGYIGRHSLRNETNQRNPDKAHPGNGDVCYTLEETEVLFYEAIERYNAGISNTHGLTRAEALATHVNPSADRISNQMAVTIYGDRVRASVDRGLIRLTRNGETFTYEVPDYERTISEFKNGVKVRVRYLDHLLGRGIWIYNYASGDNPADDILICECPLAKGTQRAPAEQTEQDKVILSTHIAKVARFDRMVDTYLDKVPSSLEVLTGEEADSALAAGYTSKDQIKKATEGIDRVNIDVNPDDEDQQINPRWL